MVNGAVIRIITISIRIGVKRDSGGTVGLLGEVED